MKEMKSKGHLKHICLIAMMLLIGSGTNAQSIVTGGISGTVSDSSGGVVAGAQLTLKNPGTGETFSAASSGSGDYTFALLKPGTYTLSAAKDGFQTITRNVTVVLGQTVNANVVLAIGSSTTTVEVSGELAQLQTENANISTNFETRQIQKITNPGGDVTYIAQTAPGV